MGLVSEVKTLGSISSPMEKPTDNIYVSKQNVVSDIDAI